MTFDREKASERARTARAVITGRRTESLLDDLDDALAEIVRLRAALIVAAAALIDCESDGTATARERYRQHALAKVRKALV